jgi:hypothetical protein
MHKRALETRESICVPRTAKPFFIPMVHGPLRVLGHVAAPELSSQEAESRAGKWSPKPRGT